MKSVFAGNRRVGICPRVVRALTVLLAITCVTPAAVRGFQQSGQSEARDQTADSGQNGTPASVQPSTPRGSTPPAVEPVHASVKDNSQPAGLWVPPRQLQSDPVPEVRAIVVYQPMPILPPESVRQHHEGTTGVRVFFGVDGRVLDVVVVKSSGYREIDEAAIETAKKWKIRPGTKNGLPLRGSITAAIRFIHVLVPPPQVRLLPPIPASFRAPPPSGPPLWGPPPALPPGPRPDAPATIHYGPLPPTPLESVRQRHSGTTVVRIFYDDRGVPWHVSVETTSGYPELDQVATNAALVWEITPEFKGGLPLKGSITVPITFTLPKH